MSVHRHINPLPFAMEIEKGEGGYIKRLENYGRDWIEKGRHNIKIYGT